MAQITVRLSDEDAGDLKRVAADEGKSVNQVVTELVRAKVDPIYTGDEAERLRERLRRAGLLAEVEPYEGPVPTPEEFERARKAAGRGKPLSDYVSEGRGPR